MTHTYCIKIQDSQLWENETVRCPVSPPSSSKSNFYGLLVVEWLLPDSDEKSKDDQTNIVEAAREDLEKDISPQKSKDSQPKIVGKRDSAVLPMGSSKSSFDELPVVQC